MGTGSFLGVKRPGHGADHPPPSKCQGHERVELYIYSPSGLSWPVIGRTLLYLFYVINCKWEGIIVLHIADLFQQRIIVFKCNFCEHWCVYPILPWISILFHLLPFTHSHFHFLIIVEFETPMQWINIELWAISFTKSLCLPILHSCPSLMSQITYSYVSKSAHCRSQWPRELRHRSAATCLLGLWVRIRLSVCCE